MQAIVTRYLPPTRNRGARVSARCDARRIVVPWQYETSAPGAHAHAAHELAIALGWRGVWIGGCLPSRHADGYVFVLKEELSDAVAFEIAGAK